MSDLVTSIRLLTYGNFGKLWTKISGTGACIVASSIWVIVAPIVNSPWTWVRADNGGGGVGAEGNNSD